MSELKASDFDICDCKDEFTIEPHGDGEVLYFGRCNHKHGFNLCHVTEKSHNVLEILNTRTTPKAQITSGLKSMEVDLIFETKEYIREHCLTLDSNSVKWIVGHIISICEEKEQ